MATTTDTTPVVRDDTYGVEEDLLSLAKTFFFDENEDIAISTLKPSIFGFFAQAASTIVKTGVFHRNVFYDEFFLNTASMDSSIYNFAKLYNYEVANAFSSKVYLSMAIRESEILKYSNLNPDDDGATRLFKINKATKFVFGEFEFLLPCSVFVTISRMDESVPISDFANNRWVFQARYDLNDYNLQEYKTTNPYIKMYSNVIGGEKWYIFKLEAWQMTLNEYVFDVLTSDVDQLVSYTTEFEDQLAGFKVEVQDPTRSTPDSQYMEISKEFNNAVAFTEDGEPISAAEEETLTGDYYDWTRLSYFAYPAEESVQVYFPTLSAERPGFGSSVRIRVFTTKGVLGNFQYDGNIGIQFVREEGDPNSTSEKDKSAMEVVVSNLSDAAGGKDRLGVLELKRELIKKILVRNNLITEKDLEYFFENLVETSSINQGKLMFVKQRDDILRRLFTVFLLLRDGDGRVVPTNTVDLKADYEWISSRDFVIRPGEIVVYDPDRAGYRFLQEGEFPEAYLGDSRSFVYSIPHLMYVKLDPFPRIVYYRTTVANGITVEFDQYSDFRFPFEVIVNTVNARRNGLYDNFYTFYLDMATNIDEDENYHPNNADILKSSNMRVVLALRDRSSNEIICYVALGKKKGSDTEWFVKIETEDVIVNDTAGEGRLQLVNPSLTGNLLDSAGNPLALINVPEEFDIETLVLYDPYEVETVDNERVMINKAQDSRKNREDYLELMEGLSDSKWSWNGTEWYWDGSPWNGVDSGSFFGMVAVFVHASSDYFTLHQPLANLILSDILLNSDGTLVLRSVPIIGTKYFSDYDASVDVHETLQQYEDILRSNMALLENNTQVSMKFFNTYGVARHHSTTSSNIFMEIKIRLVGTDTSIDSDIIAAIAAHVESSNDIGVLSMSNVVTMLETTFPEVRFINVVGMNQLGQQSIERTSPDDLSEMTKEELVAYVPEFLNLNTEVVDNRLAYSVKIEHI